MGREREDSLGVDILFWKLIRCGDRDNGMDEYCVFRVLFILVRSMIEIGFRRIGEIPFFFF